MNAMVEHSAAGTAARTQYLSFVSGAEQFAIGILAVREIIEYGGLSSVPMMPDCVSGVINLRGAVVPVLDLARRFGRPPAVIGKRSCIIIVELAASATAEASVLGVVVDAVHAVVELGAADIEPAPQFGSRVRSDFIAGMGKLDGRFLMLLDVDKVLSVDELGALEATLPAPQAA